MKYKNILNRIKLELGMEIKLEQMMLDDCVTTIEAESFEADYSVGIVSKDEMGNPVITPLPVGEYTLCDGNVLVVEVEGIIKSIAPSSTEEKMPEAVHPAAEATEPQMATAKKTVETISKETFFAEIKPIVEGLESELETVKAEKVELAKQVEALKVELASAAADPIVHNPEPAVKVAETPLEKFREIKKRLK